MREEQACFLTGRGSGPDLVLILRGFRLSGGPASAADPGPKMHQKRGLNYEPVLEPFWGPLGDPSGTMWGPMGTLRGQEVPESVPQEGLKRVPRGSRELQEAPKELSGRAKSDTKFNQTFKTTTG